MVLCNMVHLLKTSIILTDIRRGSVHSNFYLTVKKGAYGRKYLLFRLYQSIPSRHLSKDTGKSRK